MSEEKKDTIKESVDAKVMADEKKVEEPKKASTSTKTEENSDILAEEKREAKKEKSEAEALLSTDDIELPDDIKKKLESRKNAKGKKQIKRKKKATKKKVEVGKVYIKATYNNTIINITDLNGNSISWASAGMAGFKGPKKATSYASQIITKIACMKAKEEYGLKEVSIFVKGIGTGRESAVRSINANGLTVTSIKDVTPVPHNGCRPKKPRRV